MGRIMPLHRKDTIEYHALNTHTEFIVYKYAFYLVISFSLIVPAFAQEKAPEPAAPAKQESIFSRFKKSVTERNNQMHRERLQDEENAHPKPIPPTLARPVLKVDPTSPAREPNQIEQFLLRDISKRAEHYARDYGFNPEGEEILAIGYPDEDVLTQRWKEIFDMHMLIVDDTQHTVGVVGSRNGWRIYCHRFSSKNHHGSHAYNYEVQIFVTPNGTHKILTTFVPPAADEIGPTTNRSRRASRPTEESRLQKIKMSRFILDMYE